MILKVFFCGMLAAIPVALLELGFLDWIDSFPLPFALSQILYIFLGVALVEEVFKYLVVRQMVLKSPEFDEPIDAILYMIITALGFAAAENLLILFPLSTPFQFFETFFVSGFRFVGATFLHALVSGLVGFFLALSFSKSQNRFKLVASGIAIAVVLHGLYNLSIMKIEGGLRFIIPIIILISLAIFLSLAFKKVKKLKSICLPTDR